MDGEAQEEYGWYLYGIARGDGERPLGDLPAEGLWPGEPVQAVPYRDLLALASRIPLSEFTPEALHDHLEDLEWVTAQAQAHQRVLEAVLAEGALVPMKFCTLYFNETCLQAALAEHYEDFLRALGRVEGKVEWGVKVYCDRETLGEQIGAVSEIVTQLWAEAATKSSGAAYFVRRKLAETVAVEVERVADECAQDSHDRLASHAAEAVINVLQSRESTGRTDHMILNGAYFVADAQLDAFGAELRSLEAEYGELGFSFERTGPWPPYNFAEFGVEEGVAHELTGG
jgi:hypothetical protein